MKVYIFFINEKNKLKKNSSTTKTKNIFRPNIFFLLRNSFI